MKPLLFEFLRATDESLGDESDEMWFARMQDAVSDHNKIFNTSFDENETVLEYVRKTSKQEK